MGAWGSLQESHSLPHHPVFRWGPVSKGELVNSVLGFLRITVEGVVIAF